jgi:hypothetical protein
VTATVNVIPFVSRHLRKPKQVGPLSLSHTSFSWQYSLMLMSSHLLHL